ncbi:MAG: hypothetical protein WC516_06680 [Patescibacteria group bacterium]
MILKNGRYFDENNNNWNSQWCTEDQAKRNSESLINCSDCSDCHDCRGCSDCINCRGCSYCSDCGGCSDCRDCRDFKNNPQRYVTLNIGSRNSQTYFYFNTEKNQVICGCFNRTLDEFEKKVLSVYSGNEQHGIDYRKQIQIMRYLLEQNNGN